LINVDGIAVADAVKIIEGIEVELSLKNAIDLLELFNLIPPVAVMFDSSVLLKAHPAIPPPLDEI
jgi:hypothetical protein